MCPACGGEAQSDENEGLHTTTTAAPECSAEGTDDDGLPAPAGDAAPPDGSERVFAATRFYIGDIGADGKPTFLAWAEYGFNLDLVTTTEDDVAVTCTCLPVKGAKLPILADGIDGRDNGFGSGVLPMLEVLKHDLSSVTDERVKAGGYSWLLRLHGVGAEGAYEKLRADLYEAAPRLAPDGSLLAPAHDGTDVWPISADSIEGGDPAAPKLTFEDAYLVPQPGGGGSLWVGRGQGSITLTLPVPGELRVVIHDPTVVLPLSADRKTIARGMVGGTLDTSELLVEAERVAGVFSKKACRPSATLDSVLQQVQETQDMPAEGAKSGLEECGRISIGIAFDAEVAALGEVAPPPELPPSQCKEK